jgi:UDP-glucose 4-epimerase
MHVLVVGLAGSIGRMLAEELSSGGTRVTGLDARPCVPPVPAVTFVRARLRQPEWTPLLAEVDGVVLLSALEGPGARRAAPDLVADAKFVLDAARQAGVRKIVHVSSAALYGPQPAGPLTEDAPVRGHQASAYARARAQLADYLDMIEQMPYAGALTRLRAAWLCDAAHPDVLRAVLHLPPAVCPQSMLTVVHSRDVSAAVRLALQKDLPGIYHTASGALSFGDLVALRGSQTRRAGLFGATVRAWWRWRWRGQSTPPGWLRALCHGQPLNADRLRAAGWTPQFTAETCVREALAALDPPGGTAAC